MKPEERLWPYLLLFTVIMYIMFSMTYYRFDNPEMTDTQLLINIFDALLWR